MYLKSTTYQTMEGEPHLGTQTETEIIEEEGEALALLITYMADQQEVPTTFTAIDDYSDDDLELEMTDYLDNNEIDILNAMFIETDEWTEQQIIFVLENLVWKCTTAQQRRQDEIKQR